MKKFKIVFLIFIVATSSCSKNKSSILNQQEVVNNDALLQIQKTSNLENQKIMYRTLSKYEKCEIWSQKFTNYISSNNLNKGQIAFINSIMVILKPELFELGSTLRASLNEKEINAMAIKHFGVNEASFLFANISMSNNETEKNEGGGGGTGSKCAQNHDWCGTYTTCRPWICTPQSGCGFLFLYECDGGCQSQKIAV